jgi:hypothetical protein
MTFSRWLNTPLVRVFCVSVHSHDIVPTLYLLTVALADRSEIGAVASHSNPGMA